MKKQLRFISGGVLLCGLLFTGCVKNEESSGVEAMRKAQASLIQARADHESALIASEVAFEEAIAAIQQANADLACAETDDEIAIL